MEGLLSNGADRVSEHCYELRLDVDLATEIVIAEIELRLNENLATETTTAEIQLQRDGILKQLLIIMKPRQLP